MKTEKNNENVIKVLYQLSDISSPNFFFFHKGGQLH